MPGAPGGRLRRRSATSPRSCLLDPDVPLRARDLVALGIDGNRFGFRLPSRERQAAVDEMLAAVGRRALRRRPGSAPFRAASYSAS